MRCLLLLLGCVVATTAWLVPAASSSSPSAAGLRTAGAAVEVHDVTVSGEGVSIFPAFSPDIERYAVTTAEATNGTLTFTAITSDPDGVVAVNGRRASGGVRTVSGLVPGDEVTVFIDDADGRAVHSFLYLPVEFPELRRAALPEGGEDPSPGHVLLTLGLWTEPSPFFETAVDANGVPAFVHTTANSLDLTRQPNGSYSVARGTGSPSGAEIVELDEELREVGRYRTVGLTHTDGHDAILRADGSRYLLAYEPDPATGRTDAVVQHIAGDNTLLFEWNSADHVDVTAETVVGDDPDYAHVNSIEVLADGDLLVSFRHLSSVFKIARTAHDGFQPGEVVWRLGGRASDFSFLDTAGGADGGPCAQHTARELPNGNILVFDNGAWEANPLCIDPAQPGGAPVARTPTRIAEWSLDEVGGVATMVRDHQVDGRFALFAGSVQPLDEGRTLVGWASSRSAVASELDALGRLVWDLRAVGAPEYFTYRAEKSDVPDATAPEVTVGELPRDGVYVQGERVRPSYGCTDSGGSTLQTCSATPVDTTDAGRASFTVSATDGAGNGSATARSYRVLAARQRPDAQIRRPGARRFRGDDVYGGARRQQVRVRTSGRSTRTALVRIQNDGNVSDRFRLAEVSGTDRFSVRVRAPGARRRSPIISPGASWTLRVQVTPRPTARRGDRVRARVLARSVGEPTKADRVAFVVRRR